MKKKNLSCVNQRGKEKEKKKIKKKNFFMSHQDRYSLAPCLGEVFRHYAERNEEPYVPKIEDFPRHNRLFLEFGLRNLMEEKRLNKALRDVLSEAGTDVTPEEVNRCETNDQDERLKCL